MKNYVQPGVNLTVAAPANVVSGQFVAVGALLGVAAYDALSGAPVEIATEGVFDLPCASADDIAAGDLLYWNAAGPSLTIVPGTDSKPLAGIAVAAAGVGVTTVRVRLALSGATGPAA